MRGYVIKMRNKIMGIEEGKHTLEVYTDKRYAEARLPMVRYQNSNKLPMNEIEIVGVEIVEDEERGG